MNDQQRLGPRIQLSTSLGTLKPTRQLKLTSFVILHVILGLVLVSLPSLASLHAYLAILVGAFLAITRPPIYAAFAATYVVGAEVLWRMTGADFFWEGGKYATVLILGLSIFHHRQKRIPAGPLFYFLLLLPSVLLTLSGTDLSTARGSISFNLSGPLALFVSAWFFSNLTMKRSQFLSMLTILVTPVVTSAAYALTRTFSLSDIRWVNDSMFATSGGFGPNQVSTIMGLGLAAVWMLLIFGNTRGVFRILLLVTGIMLFVQGLLTFSRGGMFGAAIVIAFGAVHFVRSREQRVRLVLLFLVLLSFIAYIVLPSLDDFTQGFLGTRFTDTNLTHRDTILLEELGLFQENTLAGVGPGMGNISRGAAAHTELTRLLAEHGLFGVASLVLLIAMGIQRYLNSRTAILRGLTGSFILWSLIVMTNAAMRLAAISFTFGLAFAHIEQFDDS